jgi:DNA-binding beta-propeller fold protein YncE
VDEATNTIYVENQGDGTVSVINGADCNGTDTSGCNQSWPTVTVGNSPQALGLNPNNHTVYVTNTDDDTVSVIDGNRCNGTNTSGCGQTPATIPVGAGPRAVGILFDKNTVFVGNRDDLTVSVIDGSTCNGTNVSGCPQAPPPAVLVGAFPSTGGNGNNILSRRIAVDQAKRIAYVPIIGDSDVALLDGNACRAGHVNDCHVKIVHERVGGFPIDATVDESSGTVYVSNDTDGTVSFFPSEH